MNSFIYGEHDGTASMFPVCTHPLEQVGPENSHEDEDAEEAQAAHKKQDLRHVRPEPVTLEGVLRRGGVTRLQYLPQHL